MSDLLNDQISTPARGDLQPVPCVYCREPIGAQTFVYWSAAKRLLSASCPSCLRRVTLSVATWRRWSGVAGGVAG